MPPGCHLFGDRPSIFASKWTTPIRRDEPGEWFNSYSSYMVRLTKDEALCLLPHPDLTPNVIRTAGGGWPSSARKHYSKHHPELLTIDDCVALNLSPVTRKPLSTARGGLDTDHLNASATGDADDDGSVLDSAAKGASTFFSTPKKRTIVSIVDYAPRYLTASRSSFSAVLAPPMRAMIDGIAADLGGSIKWCSRTHLTSQADKFMADQLLAANKIEAGNS